MRLSFFLPRIPNLWLIVIPHCLPYNGIRWREVPSERGAAASGLRRARHKKQTNREKINSYTDLSVGDLVVHEYHGIGRFAGIVQMPVDGAVKDLSLIHI